MPAAVGEKDGVSDGFTLGMCDNDGYVVGEEEGMSVVGDEVGVMVGLSVGALVGR